MPITFMELIERYKDSVSICDVEEAADRIANEPDLVVIDVREGAEFEAASIQTAINIPRGFLEFRIAATCSKGDQPILLHCKTGGRAVLAAKTLAAMGYERVAAVVGDVEDLIAAVK